MKSPRPLTAVDRMLAWSDEADRAAGEPRKARRRTHRRFGQLDVVIIERTGEPTVVYLSNDEGVIVEARPSDLSAVMEVLRDLLAAPPPARRRR